MATDRYLERPPPPAARALLTCVWSRSITVSGLAPARIVPDGCVDVIWHRESGQLFVAGPDTHAHLTTLERGTLVGVRFRTGRSPAGLGLPAEPLRDGRVDLADLWCPGRVRRLADELAASATTDAAQRVLTETVISTGISTALSGVADPAVPAMLRLVRQDASVTTLADVLGMSDRQLRRRCHTAFGYGPKTLHRVLRFDRALRMARAGTALADVAYGAGFADQAHLSREVRALAGVPLRALLSR